MPNDETDRRVLDEARKSLRSKVAAHRRLTREAAASRVEWAAVERTHGPQDEPAALLSFLNEHLEARYTCCGPTFVTALYGIFDPATRCFRHAVAGHPRPRFYCSVERSVSPSDAERGLPLGVEACLSYIDHETKLLPGDRILIHTDGLNEARNAAGEFFGHERADALLRCNDLDPRQVLQSLLDELQAFTGGLGPDDDCTIIVANVR